MNCLRNMLKLLVHLDFIQKQVIQKGEYLWYALAYDEEGSTEKAEVKAEDTISTIEQR